MRINARMLHASLPNDAVVLSASFREGLSVLFRGEIVFETEDDAIELDALLWSELALELYDDEQPDMEPRPFHGMITEATYLSRREGHHFYRVVFEPSLCTLAYRARSRIFQEKTAEAIINEVISDAGLDAGAFVWNLTEEHAERRYCAQYRESELAFILRLLEDEGIYFWFDHDAAGHTMRFSDAYDGFAPIEGDPDLPFSFWNHISGDSVQNVVFGTQVTHDHQRLKDWDFNQPASPREGIAGSEDSLFTLYEYPTGLHDSALMDITANRRLDEALQERYRITGESNCLRLLPFRTFNLLGVQPEALVGQYLFIGVEHRYKGVDSDDPRLLHGYFCTFEAQRSDFPFRPPRVTPRPRVEGIDSAVVTGPGGEEIHVDEIGRIKAHLYWDREGAVDDSCSRWIRVQQNNTSGGMILPRIGWEMSVAYVDGDPDRPLALQKLYNLETMPPYGLPANQTQSSFQSSTSPGGGSVNEVRMQDANGGQEFAVYASRDYMMVAGHDKTETIGVDAEEAVNVDASTEVGVNQSISIGGNQTLGVAGATVRDVTGSMTVDVGGNDDWGVKAIQSYNCNGSRDHTIGSMHVVLCNHFGETVNGSCTRTIDAAQAIIAAGGYVETVGGSKSETVGAAKMEVIAGSKEEGIGASKALTSGAILLDSGQDVAFAAEGAIAITSAGSITEKVGGAFSVTGSQVRVTAPGGAKLKGGSGKFILKGGTLKVDAAKFGSGGGPDLKLEGKVDFKK